MRLGPEGPVRSKSCLPLSDLHQEPVLPINYGRATIVGCPCALLMPSSWTLWGLYKCPSLSLDSFTPDVLMGGSSSFRCHHSSGESCLTMLSEGIFPPCLHPPHPLHSSSLLDLLFSFILLLYFLHNAYHF